MLYLKIKVLILILFFCVFSKINAQKNKTFSSIDKVALNIPDSLTTSSEGIATYINTMELSDENKLRVIYIWITKNIKYDAEKKYSFSQDTTDITAKTLNTRKGVCTNYAKLYSNIANKVGIKSNVVYGYTKQNGQVDCNPHSWCVSIIDSNWYIFDPTWGSGFFQNSKFIHHIDDTYFKMSPDKAIKTHMPFDPLWQLLNYPISNLEFCNKKTDQKKETIFFDFLDTIKSYEKRSVIKRIISKRDRIANNGIDSYLIFTIIQHLDTQIASYYDKNTYGKYEIALHAYKEGIYMLNRFIEHRNNHFLPNNGDLYLKQKIEDIENSFTESIVNLESIDKPNLKLERSISQLYKSINAIMINVNKQSLFLDKFIKTPKTERRALFYD